MEKETQVMVAALIVLVILLFVWNPMTMKSKTTTAPPAEHMKSAGRFGAPRSLSRERLSAANAAKAWGKVLTKKTV